MERDSEGKEIRYPVMLTAMEKLVARKVCLAFKVSLTKEKHKVFSQLLRVIMKVFFVS